MEVEVAVTEDVVVVVEGGAAVAVAVAVEVEVEVEALGGRRGRRNMRRWRGQCGKRGGRCVWQKLTWCIHCCGEGEL